MWLNVPEVADRLGTSQRFVRRLVAERRLPYTKLGKHVRIADAAVEAFIGADRIETVSAS